MGMCILPIQDDKGNDLVALWGQLLRDAKNVDMMSKKGKAMNKTNLYIRHGMDDSAVISADAWFALGDVCSGAKKGDFFFGIGVLEEDSYNGQTTMRFTTGGGSMRYGFAVVAKKPFFGKQKAETFKEAEVPMDVFADINQENLPF